MGVPTKNSIMGQFINGRSSQDDFLQLANNHGGTVFAWIDYLGNLQGTFASSIAADVQYINPALSNIPSLSVIQVGASGSTSYSYTVFAVLGNLSLVSSAVVTTTTGNATLSGSAYNQLSWTAVTGATSYSVYRVSSSGTPGTTGTIAANTTALTLNDTGLSVINTNNPFTQFGNALLWQQNGYVGIQNGLQVGVPWTSISSNSPIAEGSPFNTLGAGNTVQINTIADPDSATNFKTGCLSLTLDGFPNYLTTESETSTALQIYVQGRVNPNNPVTNYGGIFNNLSIQIDTGVTGTATSIGTWARCSYEGAGSHSGTEGLFGSLIAMENQLTGTCANMSHYVGEFASFVTSGTLTNLHYFNINQFTPNASSVTNAYGFINSVSLASATAFSASFYSIDQGTGANNFVFYSAGGNNYFGGTGANTTSLVNTAAATAMANADSPELVFKGQAWLGGSPSSVTRTYTIQEKDGVLQFAKSGSVNPVFPYQFDGSLSVTGVFSPTSASIDFQTGNAAATYTVSAAATAVGSLTTYTVSTIASGGQPVLGQNITIAGFVAHVSNNGTFVVHDATPTTITVYNSSGIAETHAATGTLDADYYSASGYTVELGNNSGSFPIQGTTYYVASSFQPSPNYPAVTISAKGDVKDAAYLRILNDGSTGNHGLEVGAIIDGTGTTPVTIQLGHFGGISEALFSNTVNAPTLIESATHTPSSAADTGTTGQIAWDASFIYICTATNTWKRVGIASW